MHHPVRLEEGRRTRIDPAARVRTIEAAVKNLEIAYCIEPIGSEHTNKELAEMIDFSIRVKSTTAAVTRRIHRIGAPGSEQALRFLKTLPYNVVGNSSWAVLPLLF